jgi:putative Mg2+ transporter-C (MgtC) family protein
VVVGGLIGIERGMKHRPAGLRTYMVVCLGACLVMLTNQYIFQIFGTGDPVRMGAQVVSGIGFLGAGVIFKNGNVVRGITTAAGIWATAAIGMAFGAGMYIIGLFTTAFIMLVQILLHKFPVGNDIHNTNEIIIVMVDTPASRDIIHNKLKHEWGIVVSTHAYREEDGRRMVQLSVKATSTMTPDKMMEMLDKYPDIVSIST